MRFLEHVLIPAIESNLDTVDSGVRDTIGNDLAAWKEVATGFTALYNEHRIAHPPTAYSVGLENDLDLSRSLILKYRQATSGLLAPVREVPNSRSESTSESASKDAEALAVLDELLVSAPGNHLHSTNDPIHDLSTLITLDELLLTLKRLDTSEANHVMAGLARNNLTGSSRHVGDTITKTFPGLLAPAEDYPPLDPSRLQLEPTLGLRSLAILRDRVAAPFPLLTYWDLRPFEAFVAGELDKASLDRNAPVVKLPGLDAQIDRAVLVILLLPIIIWSALQVMAYDVKKRTLAGVLSGTEVPPSTNAGMLRLFSEPGVGLALGSVGSPTIRHLTICVLAASFIATAVQVFSRAGSSALDLWFLAALLAALLLFAFLTSPRTIAFAERLRARTAQMALLRKGHL